VRGQTFDREYLQREFRKLASKTKIPIVLFIIGGGGLAFYGLKETTKDIDVVLQSPNDLKTLTEGLGSLKYESPSSAVITRPYSQTRASAILENAEGFRWNVFDRQVCNALMLSNEMKTRATELYRRGPLRVLLASKEDIFLFKGVTEREADLDDMRLLAESGLDWNIINQECQNQSTSTGRLWENALYQKLIDLREKYHIESPIEKPLRKRAEQKLIEITLLDEIKKGNNAVTEISRAIDETDHLVRTSLNKLARKRLIRIDRSHRPYKYLLNIRSRDKKLIQTRASQGRRARGPRPKSPYGSQKFILKAL